MGAALAQKFAMEGFEVVLHDRASSYLCRGIDAIQQTLKQGVERKLFSETEAQNILTRISTSEKLESLRVCDLVVEAIFEDYGAKQDLFAKLSTVVEPTAILATNTSSFSVSELARGVVYPGRFIGLHYFFHAAKNRLVEIIPGEKTTPTTLRAAERFAMLTGKDPIVCRDRPGFVVNRFFVPWLNESVRLLEEGVASPADIDAVCMKAFGIGMGPFALMNATGVPVAYHAEETLESLGNLYHVAAKLKEQALAGKPWEIGEPSAAIAADVESRIRDRMLGVVFFVCGQILEEEVCSPTELNRGARIGLAWRRGPMEMMRALGEAQVQSLITGIAERYGHQVPRAFTRAFEASEFVTLRHNGKVAVITMSRPEDLNALNEAVMAELEARFVEAEADPNCETIIITGTGKAFVAGADIGFFIKNMKSGAIDKIVNFTKYGQEVLDCIDRSPKRVIALINGMALGGGLELALAADAIYALPDAQFAFPETGIGIYPGLGGTQRTQRRVGKGLTKYLIFTGDMIGAAQAQDLGLIDSIISADQYFNALDGDLASLPAPHGTETKWQPVGAFFEVNTVDGLLNGIKPTDGVSEESLAKWRKRIGQKAPLALHVAEKLIDEAKGCASELEDLPAIFTSNDAMLGLTSVGKKVTFAGN